MDRILTKAMLVALSIILAGLVLSQVFGDHTDSQLTPAEKVAKGVYDPDAIVFATSQLQRIANDARNYPEKEVSFDDTLYYLVYLAEGSEQGKVDYCQRVVPLMSATHQVGDRHFGETPTLQQQQNLQRLNEIRTAQEKSGACTPNNQSAQQVST